MNLTEKEKELLMQAEENPKNEVYVGGTDYAGRAAGDRLVNLGFFKTTLPWYGLTKIYTLTVHGAIYWREYRNGSV